MSEPISVNQKLVELIAEHGAVEIATHWTHEDESDVFYSIGITKWETFEPFCGESDGLTEGDEFYSPVEAIDAAYAALLANPKEGEGE